MSLKIILIWKKYMRYCRYLALPILISTLLLSACTTVIPEPEEIEMPDSQVIRHQTQVSFAEIPGWSDDNFAEVWPAFERSCRVNTKQAAWKPICEEMEKINGKDTDAVKHFFETWFVPYRITMNTGSDTGLATGYYEPVLRGSYQKRGAYQTALYRVPDDLLDIEFTSLYPQLKGMRLRGRLENNLEALKNRNKEQVIDDLVAFDLTSAYPKLAGLQLWGKLEGRKIVPYPGFESIDFTKVYAAKKVVPYETRGELESSDKLVGQEILWVDDVIDAFFMEIQGSGRIYLPESRTTVRLAYANQNGRPYRSIGRYLINKGELKPGQASAQQIKKWVRNHPDRLLEVLSANPSYVFFREEKLTNPNEGPKGSQGVPLTPERSIAVDRKFIPMGTPVFLNTTMPNTTIPLRRLVMAQDTGGAISGPVRADFFWGWGNGAGAKAGKMKQRLKVWILLPKNR